MASTSFPLSNQFPARRFSPPSRFVATCATSARTSDNALHTASFYQVLGVQTGASRQEIKSAYRKLARVLHPDVASDDATSAADDFMRVHAAYATLSDPEKRALYDKSLLRRRRPLGSGFSEMTRRRRNWETDQCW